jgi:hypothetical protein
LFISFISILLILFDEQLEDFLKIIVSILNSWNKPLYHLETELHCMKGAPDAILIRANAIRTLNRELLETILMILSRVSSLPAFHFTSS